MSLSEEILKKLNKIYGKYMATQGLPVWGTIVKTAQGNYRVLYVDDDGKLVTTATVSGTVDISDDWTRQLGQVDIARYLGSAIGLTNPLHAQIVVSGAVVDPRSIRALVKTTDEIYSVLRTDAGAAYDARQIRSLVSGDSITAYGSQTQALLQRASTYDLLVALRQAGSELSTTNPIFTGVVDASGNRMPSMDASTRPGYVDIIDRAARLAGIVYGNLGQLQQKTTSLDLFVCLRQGGSLLSYANPIFASITDGIETLAIDTNSRAEVTPYQATRTNLAVQPEREDLVMKGGKYSPNNTGVEVVAASGSLKVKVFDAGYHCYADGEHYFYFGTSTTLPTMPSAKVFLYSGKLGHYRQTYPNPKIGAAGDGLYIGSGVSETNMPLDVGYKQE